MDNSLYTRSRELRNDFDKHILTNTFEQRVRDFLFEYVQSNCAHPKKIVIRDKFTNQSREIFVPCGKCAHCRSQRQAEWSTRMILQTLYTSKYAYFVTLTYRSFDCYDDIPVVLRDSYYRQDDFNEFHRLTYSPCLLRIEHVQRFMKYLRKIHGADPIKFFVGSEYGSHFGRPHHHLVLWSDEPISREDIVRAWSCRLPKQKRTIHIGRIDYNDLNANGTVIKCDGINFGNDMRKCFNYVCKYVTKSFINLNDDVDKHSRLNLFILDLCQKNISNQQVNEVFNQRVKHLVSLYADWAAYFADYCREKEFQELKESGFYGVLRGCIDPQIKFKYFIDHETSDYSYLLGSENYATLEETQQLAEQWYKGSIKPCVLRKVFNCFCNSSRASGVGMAYYENHAQEYQIGVFNLPTYRGKKLVLPSLFVRETKKRLQRYFQENYKIIGDCSSTNLLVNKNYFDKCFPQLSRVDLLAASDGFCETRDSCGNICTTKKIANIYLPDNYVFNEHAIDFLYTPYAFKDYIHKTKCLVFVDSDGSAFVRHYQYNRKIRSYEYVFQQSFEVFAHSLMRSFLAYSDYYARLFDHSQLSKEQLNNLIEDVNMYCDNFAFDRDIREIHDDYDIYTMLYDAHLQLLQKLRDSDFKNSSLKIQSV